ncbi:16665_t:CDS:1, partial [Funneliformis mosseae]
IEDVRDDDVDCKGEEVVIVCDDGVGYCEGEEVIVICDDGVDCEEKGLLLFVMIV